MGGVLGWGSFASMIGALSVGWAGRSWPPALAVAALGAGSTGLLWSIGRRPWTALPAPSTSTASEASPDTSPGDD